MKNIVLHKDFNANDLLYHLKADLSFLKRELKPNGKDFPQLEELMWKSVETTYKRVVGITKHYMKNGELL